MKRILCSLLIASLPFGSVLADAPKSKNAKVTLVYQHELPNVPGKSIKGVLVEYGPGGYSPGGTSKRRSPYFTLQRSISSDQFAVAPRNG
jgi:quercetin dioxygenase-like cupin family protein